MKKIFTLGLGLLFTVAMFAADRRPLVTISSTRKYEIMIDGREYLTAGSSVAIPNLFNGQHEIKVYKVKPGFFMSTKKLVSSTCFQVNNFDVQLSVDRFGQVQISQSRIASDWNDRHDGRKDNDSWHKDRDNNSRDHNRKF